MRWCTQASCQAECVLVVVDLVGKLAHACLPLAGGAPHDSHTAMATVSSCMARNGPCISGQLCPVCPSSWRLRAAAATAAYCVLSWLVAESQ